MNYRELKLNVTGIYKITCIKTKKIYIGQSKCVRKRWRTYQNNIENSNRQMKLYRSFKKYGINKHKFEIVTTCDVNQLDDLERYYQDLYNCIGKNGLNLILQKCSYSEKGYSKETIEKKKRIMTGINNPMYGKKLSEQAKKQISEANKGRRYSDEINAKKGRRGKDNAFYGKTHSDELKRSRVTDRSNIVFVRLDNGMEYNFECVRDCADFFKCTTKNILFRDKRRKQGIEPKIGMFKGVYLEILTND